MRVRCFLILLVVCGSLAAQTEQTLRIAQFKGLNTVDMVPDISEAQIAHNIDLSRSGIGTIAKRYGYEMIDSLTAISAIKGLYALQFDDGSKYMMVIGTDPDSGWGRIYVSNEGSENFEPDSMTELYSRFPITEDIFVSKLRDQYYITTSVARGVVLGRVGEAWSVRPFPMVGPGEPIIVPVATSDSVYYLNGTYRYIIQLRRIYDTAYNTHGSAYTTPVKVQNGKVYMTKFPWMPPDTSSASAVNFLYIYRTKGDHGTIDPSDYAYYTGQFIGTATATAMAAVRFIDSIPDDSLSATDSIQLMDEAIIGFDEVAASGDTGIAIGANVNRRYGAPGLVARDSFIAADTMYDGSKIGPYWGWTYPIDTGATADAEGIKASGVSYICTFIDTITSLESEAGGAFAMIHDTADTIRSYTLSIPRPSTGWGNTAINLYRAKITLMTHTVHDRCGIVWFTADPNDGWFFCGQARLDSLVARYGPNHTITWFEGEGSWKNRAVTDTVFLEQYKLLAQISDTSTTYTDTLRTDSLYSHDVYQQRNVPPFLSSTFAFNGRLYGTYGSYLYRSEGADAGTWGVFDRVDINPGSDAIMAAWPGQFALRIAEQFSNYNVTVDGFAEPEIVGRWGCLAPKSLAFCPAGPIYLSAGGVVLEHDGEYLERTIVPGIISDKIGNFSSKTPVELKAARGLWLPREQQYWLHIGDTTWVWDWIATQRLGQNVWTTSSIAFAGGTLYDQADDFEVIAGRSLYFWMDDDSRIYRYGKGIANEEQDYNGTGSDRPTPSTEPASTWPIEVVYQSGPILWGAELSQIRAMNLYMSVDTAQAVDSTASLFEQVIGSPSNTDWTIAQMYQMQGFYRRYLKREVAVDPAVYYQFKIFTDMSTPIDAGTAIQMIEFYYIPDAERVPFTQ